MSLSMSSGHVSPRQRTSAMRANYVTQLTNVTNTWADISAMSTLGRGWAFVSSQHHGQVTQISVHRVQPQSHHAINFASCSAESSAANQYSIDTIIRISVTLYATSVADSGGWIMMCTTTRALEHQEQVMSAATNFTVASNSTNAIEQAPGNTKTRSVIFS